MGYYITSGQKIVSIIMQLYASLANKSTLQEEKINISQIIELYYIVKFWFCFKP